MPATEMFHNLISIFCRKINKQRNVLRKLLLVESTYISILTSTASDNGKNLYHEKTGNHHQGLHVSAGTGKVTVSKTSEVIHFYSSLVL